MQRLQEVKQKNDVKFFFKIFWRLFVGNLAQGVALSSFVLRVVPYPPGSRFKFYQISIGYPVKHRRKKTRRLPGRSFVFVLLLFCFSLLRYVFEA